MDRVILVCLMLLGSLQANAQRDTQRDTQRDPVATLGNIKYENIDGKFTGRGTIGAILADPRVSPNHDSCKVLKYEVSIAAAGGDEMGPFKVYGDQLSEEVKTVLRNNARNSGVIYIEEIKAVCPDRRVRNLNSLAIKYTR